MEDNVFVVVDWPEAKILFEQTDFYKNSGMVNTLSLQREFGFNSYFVRKSWLDKINKETNVNNIKYGT